MGIKSYSSVHNQIEVKDEAEYIFYVDSRKRKVFTPSMIWMHQQRGLGHVFWSLEC